MTKYIKIDRVIKKNNRLEILFEVLNNLKKFFFEEIFWIDYEFNIEKNSDSNLIVPFISNILPIAWLMDAEIIVKEIDQDFFESIDEFKKGYIDMYPNVNFFDTKLKYDKVVKNLKQV